MRRRRSRPRVTLGAIEAGLNEAGRPATAKRFYASCRYSYAIPQLAINLSARQVRQIMSLRLSLASSA
jgi:hypothetical protein